MSRAYVAEGDSITSDTSGIGGVTPYPDRYLSFASPTINTFVNNAVGGSALANMNLRAATLDAMLPLGTVNILSVLVGANDSIGGSSLYATAAIYAAAVASYLDARRAAGWKVVLCSITPIDPGTNPTFNSTLKDPVNIIYRSWAPGLHYDGFADFGADAIMGDDTSFTDFPAYWHDGIHPNNLGQTRLETIIRPVLNSIAVSTAVGAALSQSNVDGESLPIIAHQGAQFVVLSF